MIMKLELSPEVEAGLLAQARTHGLSLEVYAVKLLREHVTNPAKPRAESRKSLAQLFADSPLKGLDLKFERDQDTGRVG
jgi:hypothetical protein